MEKGERGAEVCFCPLKYKRNSVFDLEGQSKPVREALVSEGALPGKLRSCCIP